MRFDLQACGAEVANRLMTGTVTPRPIAWVSTVDAAGRRNLAPFSFFNALSSWPAVLGFGIQSRPDGRPKDTRANIAATGEFVVNLVPFAAAEAMNTSSAPFDPETDEIAAAGLDVVPSDLVAPPRLAASPAAFECRLRQIIELAPDRALILGDALALHLADGAVIDGERGRVDARVLDLVGRMHGPGSYVRATDLFSLERPSGTSA